MANFSVRAFEQAQRRKQYPQRQGPVGVACIQRDILRSSKENSIAAEYLWMREISAEKSGDPTPDFHALRKNDLSEHLVLSMLYLLQVSGALGLDLVAAIGHELDKRELTVV